jgi:cytochrome c biogenesis protein CcmG/thiol:disulfide interchange protein DsbE
MSERDDSNGGALYSLSLGVLVVALLVGYAVFPRLFHADVTEGKEAPDFALSIVANAYEKDQTAITMSQLRGHPVLLDFWATWCGPCQIEAPIVDRVAKRFKDRGLIVVGVNTSDPDSNAGGWARAHGISYPIVFDAHDEVAHRYGVSSLPTLVVVSKTGKILALRSGITDDSDLESLVRDAL